MGVGKSGVGRDAARRLGVRFVDTDREVERLCGCTVGEIFARRGEAFFREREREVLDGLSGDAIVATGGGLPCREGAMEAMNGVGRTVWLRSSPPKLLRRLRHGQARRPKISGMDERELLDYIVCILPEREVFYSRASMTIDCDVLSDESVTVYVMDYYAAVHAAGRG